jgi:hypothetical protein
VAGAVWLPAPAQASFGIEGFNVTLTKGGAPASEAGTHPDRLAIHVGLATAGGYTDGDLRDLRLDLPAGLLANPAAVDQCSAAQFSTPRVTPFEASLSGENCPDATQVGVAAVHSSYAGGSTRYFGIFDLSAPYGSAEAFGLAPFGVPMVFTGQLRDGDKGLSFDLANLSQALNISSLDLSFWGTPWEYKYDVQRGDCLNEANPAAYHGQPSYWDNSTPPKFHPGTCYVPQSGATLSTPNYRSYLTLPTVCGQTMQWRATARSWQQPGFAETGFTSPDAQSQPLTIGNCLEVLTKATMQLRTDRAGTGTGIVFGLDVNDGGGFLNPAGHVRSPIRTARARLPEGLTINPSLASGLGVCTEAEFARESVDSALGSGCPASSKIGEVSVDAILGLTEPLRGSVFLAKPYDNPTDSLIAVYITLSSQRRGLFFSSFGTVEPDPATGRLLVTFDNLPPLHYDDFRLSLREGERAAMVSPQACGAYLADIDSTPWSDPAVVVHATSIFLIQHGEAGADCPAGGAPFHPALQAGSVNPNAGSYTPFKLRMTRTDAEQEITSYSATFPPGLLARLTGIPYCPDAALAAAKQRTGLQELQAPSCPTASQIGHTLAGYGVGGTLAYAPGALYLAGPYHGAPLSTVAVDSALVGPFDLGVVVVRSAIRVDPRTAQVSIDSAGSDPIPHMLKGIPLHLRDIRVEIDRPDFTLNPTNCDPLSTSSTLTGAGADVFNPADDTVASAANRYQLSNCSAYQLKPRMKLKLIGGTRRGRYPALRTTYLPRPGDANLKQAVVSLPKSIFLAQEHITEICTMPRYRAGDCPKGSRLGFARAVTPLLDEPLQGPVFVRANPSHLLPDLVAQISGRGFQIELVGRIDKTRSGGLRADFEQLPDAPVSRFTMTLVGGDQGLLVNAANLCAAPQFATARFVAHNNATRALRPRVAVDCGKRKKKKGAHRR